MARYEINYLNGDTETITADHVRHDGSARMYVFHPDSDPREGDPVALVPEANVRSIVRQDQAVTS